MLTDSRSGLESRFLEALVDGRYRLPDEAQKVITEPACVPDFFDLPNICLFYDGSIHDEPSQRATDDAIRREPRARDYRVIVIRYDRDLCEQIRQYADVSGSRGCSSSMTPANACSTIIY